MFAVKENINTTRKPDFIYIFFVKILNGCFPFYLDKSVFMAIRL